MRIAWKMSFGIKAEKCARSCKGKRGSGGKDMDNPNAAVHPLHAIDDLESDILALAITVEPQTERLAGTSFLLDLL